MSRPRPAASRPRIHVDRVDLERLRLQGDAAHRLARVLRLRPGDDVWTFDGRGLERRMRIVALAEGIVELDALDEAVEVVSGGLDLVVLQALAKGDKLPRIVRSVTELGARCVALVVTRRTVARPPAARADALAQRLERVASEAARQCGRADVPTVLPPASLQERIAATLPPLRLVAWEQASRPMAEALPDQRPPGVAVFVGPEGGLEEGEVEQLTAAGFQPVSLGPRVLRTETAGPALCAILMFRWGDLGAAGI